MIELTPSAARQIESMKRDQATPDHLLRLFIEDGGCSGLEYGMSFALPESTDIRMESLGVSFLVDSKSLEKLNGSEIHFDDGLTGKGFEIRNPNAESTCGCGRSFN